MLFYSFKNYLKDRFPGLKVYKIALDAGFTCPHRPVRDRSSQGDDRNTVSNSLINTTNNNTTNLSNDSKSISNGASSSDTRTGGCIYCENRSFSPYARLSPRPSISEQIAKAMEFYRQRHKADKFIIYFQAYTNTLGPTDKLKTLYDEALSHPDIVGLSIGTRPDCVPDKTLDLITEYTKRYDVWLEYGLQSAHDKTLEFINRGHKYADFEDAVKRTKGRGISIAAHLILGLPGETKDDMLGSVQKVIDLGVQGIKLHHLYVARNTKLAELYAQSSSVIAMVPPKRGQKQSQANEITTSPDMHRATRNDKSIAIKVFSLDEYIPLVCDIIERLPAKMSVHRLTGELSGEYLIAPQWNTSKSAIIRMIEEELTRRGSYQGKKY